MCGMATVVKRAFGWAAALLLVTPALLTTDMILGGLTFVQSLGMATAWAGGWVAFVVVSRRSHVVDRCPDRSPRWSVNVYFDR